MCGAIRANFWLRALNDSCARRHDENVWSLPSSDSRHAERRCFCAQFLHCGSPGGLGLASAVRVRPPHTGQVGLTPFAWSDCGTRESYVTHWLVAVRSGTAGKQFSTDGNSGPPRSWNRSLVREANWSFAWTSSRLPVDCFCGLIPKAKPTLAKLFF